MSRLINLIWRLDYGLSSSFLDKLGTVRKTLQNTEPKFWSTVGDGALVYSFSAQYQDLAKGISRQMSAELQSLNGSFEWKSGTELERVLQAEEFRRVNRIVQEILRIIEVKELRRVGIRFRGMGTFADGKGGGFRRFADLLRRAFVNSIERALMGKTDDLSFTFTGKTDDSVNYRITIGPRSEADFATLFAGPIENKLREVLSQNDFTFDIDLFEQNTSFVEHNLFRWATTKHLKATEIVASLTKLSS